MYYFFYPNSVAISYTFIAQSAASGFKWNEFFFPSAFSFYICLVFHFFFLWSVKEEDVPHGSLLKSLT